MIKQKRKGLTGEGLLPPPTAGEAEGRSFEVWLLANGTSVEFQGGRYRKVKSEPEDQTTLLGEGNIEILVPHRTLVTIIKENQ